MQQHTLDSDGRVPRDLLGCGDLRLSVADTGAVGGERDGTKDEIVDEQTHHNATGEFLAARYGPHLGLTALEDTLANRGEVGYSGAQLLGALLGAGRPLGARGVADGELAVDAILINDIDRAPVGEVRHRKIEQRFEPRLVARRR